MTRSFRNGSFTWKLSRLPQVDDPTRNLPLLVAGAHREVALVDRGVIRLVVDDQEVVRPPSALNRWVDNLAQRSRHSLKVGNLLHGNNDDRPVPVEGSGNLVRVKNVEG